MQRCTLVSLVLCLAALVSPSPAARAQSPTDPVYVFHTTLGNLNVQLFPDVTPATVTNFLGYVGSGAYNSSFVHRSVPNFIWQGGGYTVDTSGNVNAIAAGPPVVNEFHISNTRGTLAMAKLGNNPNSATDEWFFNEVDNSGNLDNQNGGFTVFGRVTDSASLSVMDAIAAVPVYTFQSPFDQLPLVNYQQGSAVMFSNYVRVLSISRAARFDFNSDGHADLLWHNTSTGQMLVWDMNDQSILNGGTPANTVTDTHWNIAAVADVNHDGKPDLLWENSQTGQLTIWLMGGASGTAVAAYGPVLATVTDTHWHVVSMADFNSDGYPDMLWENSATGQLVVWYLGGTNGMSVTTYGQVFATVADTHWSVAGTADFNGDRHPDLLWRNSQSGQVLVWNMTGTNGTTVSAYGSPLATLADPTWHIVGTGDTNGDSHPDIVWQNSSTGRVLRWLLGGTGGTQVQTYGAPFATVTDTHWQIVGVH